MVSAPELHEIEQESDDLDLYLAERLADPNRRAAYEDAATRSQLLRAFISCRHRLGMSQGQVADRMGTTQSAVSDLERGATDPRLSTLQRYARAVRCRLELRLWEESQQSWRIASYFRSSPLYAGQPIRHREDAALVPLIQSLIGIASGEGPGAMVAQIRSARSQQIHQVVTQCRPPTIEEPSGFAIAMKR